MFTWKIVQTLVLASFLTFSIELSEHRGQVKLAGEPVPRVVVAATQNGNKVVTTTDEEGSYFFSDLPDGVWTLEVQIRGFVAIKKDVTVAANLPALEWDLKILPLGEIATLTTTAIPAVAAVVPTAPARPAAPPVVRPPATRPAGPTPAALAPSTDTPNDLNQSAADGLLINGSVNNGGASPFAQAAAFGNGRRTRAAYSGGVGFFADNSALDAGAFSLTGQNTPKPRYNHFLGALTFGGPLRIPRLIRNGPNFFFNYQRVQKRSADIVSTLMPTMAERGGDLSAHAGPIIDPLTGAAFAGNQIPESRISPQARALLSLFPSPNFAGSRYNYQVPLVGATHQDNIQASIGKPLNNSNQINGNFNLQRTATDLPNAFAFPDESHIWGMNSTANWAHRISPRSSLTFRYQFSRLSTRVTPYFANRVNVSGDAGIAGNNQDPLNWGPPNLGFSSGLSGLSSAQSAMNRNQTSTWTVLGSWNRRAHGFQYGAGFSRQQFNIISQQDARGTFTFNGSATGFDLADFLLGIPTTSAIAFGNADKYFRQSVANAFIVDDWKLRSGLTLNLGARWEYEAPLTEKYGRLVNLDIAPGFISATPVIGSRLLNRDVRGLQPRVSLAWRPLPASSLIVRAGYGVYRNTSVYQSIVIQMAQQAPLSKSLSVQNGAVTPLTLANGFSDAGSVTKNTFAVDPNFRVGYAHNWNVSAQRDLPASLVIVATYLGTKGSHLMQQFLPNTYPDGAVNPCPTCPSGFEYLTSNGGSRRDSGQVQLRRRLHNGFTANVQYTLAKATDDAGFNAANPLRAQNWLDLKAERAPSSFDQRHQVTAQGQYTTGMGASGGTLMGGWRGSLFKEWTITSIVTSGSGLPLTPIYPSAVKGTGATGIRPDYNGGPALDRASYSSPLPGRWGNAKRNSIAGPSQFSMDATVARTIRLGDRINADIRVDATNVLNHVTYPRWNTLVTSAQFGLPATANQMRKIQSQLKIRF